MGWQNWYIWNGSGINRLFIYQQKVKEGKVVPVHTVKAYSGSRGIAPLILKIDTRWSEWPLHTPAALLP
jgi:hypothetical protein